MKRLNLKITAAVILAVVVIVAVIALRPGRTDEITSEDFKSTSARSPDEPGISQPERLYRKAILFSSAQGSENLRYRAATEYCQQVIKEFPKSTQALETDILRSLFGKR